MPQYPWEFSKYLLVGINVNSIIRPQGNVYDLDVKVASGLLEGWMDSDGCHLGGAEEKLCIMELSGTRPMFLQSRVMLVLQVLDLSIHPTASAMLGLYTFLCVL